MDAQHRNAHGSVGYRVDLVLLMRCTGACRRGRLPRQLTRILQCVQCEFQPAHACMLAGWNFITQGICSSGLWRKEADRQRTATTTRAMTRTADRSAAAAAVLSPRG